MQKPLFSKQQSRQSITIINEQIQIYGKNFAFNDLFNAIFNFQDKNGEYLFDKITIQFILNLLDRQSIISIEKQILEQKRDLDIIDFVRTLLRIIECDQDETLFVTIALIDLFKEISEYSNSIGSIKISDITAYISDRILDKGGSYIIETKKLPQQKHFDVDINNIREIDINAPILYGQNNDSIKIIQTQKLITDCIHHDNYRVKQGAYAKEIKQIFTLDELSEKINIFDIEGKLIKTLYPFPKNKYAAFDIQQNQQILLSFCWSERQQRIGCCLKDFHMAFWEANDNFEFIKLINAHEQSIDIQTNIWFLEKLNIWITEDCKNILNIWNIQAECIDYSIKLVNKKTFIFDIIELPLLNLAALGCQDKTILIYNIPKQHQIIEINQKNGGVHSLKYFYSYEMLIVAGYLETINLYHIHLNYLDITQVGILKGHAKAVTAIEAIEQTPMVISADESGQIKVWDIRNFSCLQTISLGNKTLILKLISIFSEAKLCFLGTRVNILNFEDRNDIQKKYSSNPSEQVYPLEIELNENRNELIVCTRKEMKIYNMVTGRMNCSYIGLLENQEDEITIFKPIQFGQKFILSNQRGEINLYSLSLGEKIQKLQGHTNEVTSLKIDLKNQLIISSGWDNILKVQMIQENNSIVVRELCNTFFNKPITILELSVHHNIIVTGTVGPEVFLWDYEFLKMLWCIQFKKGVEPTSIAIINGFAILIIATNEGVIYFLNFQKKDLLLKIHLIGKINLNQYNNYFVDNGGPQSFQQAVDQQKIKEQLKIKINLGSNEDLKQGKTGPKSPFLSAGQNKTNRILLNFGQKSPSRRSELSSSKSISPHSGDDESPIYVFNQDCIFPSKMIVNIDINNTDKHEINLCKLIIASNKGEIYIFDLKNFIIQKNINYVKHANTRPNYNAKRNAKEDFIFEQNKMKNDKIRLNIDSQIVKKVNLDGSLEYNEDKRLDFELNQSKIAFWYAHKDIISVLKIIALTEDNIITGSLDGFVRIWTQRGMLLGSLNLSYPLPNLWNIELNQSLTTKRKIIYAIRIIDVIFRKYGQNLHYLEEQKLNIQRFLLDIIQKYQSNINNKEKNSNLSIMAPIVSSQVTQEQQSNNNVNQQISNQRKKKIVIMKDEYLKRDIMYDKNRQIFLKEMQGQSLKQMDLFQRVQALQNRLKNSTNFDEMLANSELQQNKLFQNVQVEERDNLPFFLNVNFRKNVVKPPQELLMDQIGIQDQYRKYFSNELNNSLKKVKNEFDSKEKEKLKQDTNLDQQKNQAFKVQQNNQYGLQMQQKKMDQGSQNLITSQKLSQILPDENMGIRPKKKTQISMVDTKDINKNKDYETIISPISQSKCSYQIHQKQKSQPAVGKLSNLYQLNTPSQQQRLQTKDFYQYALDKNYLPNSEFKPNLTEKDISLSENKSSLSQTKTVFTQSKLQSVLSGLDKKLRKSQQKFFQSTVNSSQSMKKYNFDDLYKDSSRDIISPNSQNVTNNFFTNQLSQTKNSFTYNQIGYPSQTVKSDNDLHLVDFVLKTSYQSAVSNLKKKKIKTKSMLPLN